jgi:hypothetical protein
MRVSGVGQRKAGRSARFISRWMLLCMALICSNGYGLVWNETAFVLALGLPHGTDGRAAQTGWLASDS